MAWEFVKVYCSILDSSIAKHVRTRHVFEDILKLAGPDGTVDMTVDAIVRRTGEDEAIVRAAIEELCQPDPESRSEEFEGRRLIPLAGRAFGWWVVNYRRYVEKGGSAERVRQYRERIAIEQASEEPTPPDATGDTDETPQPRKRPGAQKEIIALYTELWMKRYPGKDSSGGPLRPTLRPGDIVPAWTALSRLPPQERLDIIREYFRDDDSLVTRSYHRLGLLTVRLDALRARLAGLADPRRKTTALDVEKASVKETIERARTKAAQKGAINATVQA